MVAATESELKDAVLGDCIGLVTDTVLPPAHAFGISPIALSMDRYGVRTEVTRFGTASDWKDARVGLTCTVGDQPPIPGGKLVGDHVSETWYLQRWQGNTPRDHRWNQTLTFKAEVTRKKGSPPAPQTLTFTAKPALAALKVTWDTERVNFVGTTEAMLTTAGLAIRCERRGEGGAWEEAADVIEQITCPRKYRQEGPRTSPHWGSPEADMTFVAWVSRSVFTPGQYRFIWHVTMFLGEGDALPNLDLEIPRIDVRIAALTTREYSGAELASSMPNPAEGNHG